MNKSYLSQVPVKHEINIRNIKYLIDQVLYVVDAEDIKIKGENILIISFYSSKDIINDMAKISYRVFISLKKGKYISQDLTCNPAKWRTAALSNIIGYYCYSWYKNCAIYTNEAYEIISKYFNPKGNGNPLLKIEEFQESILRKNLQAKHKKITDRIDRIMESISDLPCDFTEWVDESALIHSRYIYYKYEKGRKIMKGYCTHCKHNVEVTSPKSGEKGVCPNCHSHIIYKPKKKCTAIEDNIQTALIQKAGNSLVIRYFNVHKSYRSHYRQPELTIQELSRDFIYLNKKDYEIKSFEWGYFKNSNVLRWCDSRYRFEFNDTVLYTKNIYFVLNKTKLQYCQIKEFAQNCHTFPVWRHITLYMKYPFIEYFIKSKLFNLTCNLLYDYYNDDLCVKGKSIPEILQVSKTGVNTIKRLNGNLRMLRVLRVSEKNRIYLDDEQLLFVSKYIKSLDKFVSISKCTTVNKILKYIKEQSEFEKVKLTKSEYERNYAVNDCLLDWADYISNCILLKYNIKDEFILFPKNLKEKHDELWKLVSLNHQKIYDEAISSRYAETLDVYGYSYKNLNIIVPKNYDDITNEGHTLHHCVGSYVERVAKNKTTILFIRKNGYIDKPFYTLEVKDNKIIQCRGKNNSSPSNEIEEFLDKFKNEKINKKRDSLCV